MSAVIHDLPAAVAYALRDHAYSTGLRESRVMTLALCAYLGVDDSVGDDTSEGRGDVVRALIEIVGADGIGHRLAHVVEDIRAIRPTKKFGYTARHIHRAARAGWLAYDAVRMALYALESAETDLENIRRGR